MPKARARSQTPEPRTPEGWSGWDDYADFYDWENAQTLDRRDVRSGRRMADARQRPRARARMRDRARHHSRRAHRRAHCRRRSIVRDARPRAEAIETRAIARATVSWLRGDIRFLPFRASARFDLVMAPYGILQSLVRESDLKATLASVARVLAPGGVFGLDLVPDLPVWKEYRNKVRFRGVAARRQVAHHAGGIGPAGSREEADGLRPGVHRTARPRAHARAGSRWSSAR